MMRHFLLVGEAQLADLHSKLVLDHPGGEADQLHKCIVSAPSGRGVFDGNVKVNRAAQKTDAGQLSRNLLLVPRATVNVKPNLQIVADDVKCTHGCAVSDLSEEELFYFRCAPPGGPGRAGPRAKLLARRPPSECHAPQHACSRTRLPRRNPAPSPAAGRAALTRMRPARRWCTRSAPRWCSSWATRRCRRACRRTCRQRWPRCPPLPAGEAGLGRQGGELGVQEIVEGVCEGFQARVGPRQARHVLPS